MKLWPQPPASPARIEPARCPRCGASGEYRDSYRRDPRSGHTFRQSSTLSTEIVGIIALASLIAASALVTLLLGPGSLWPTLLVGGILALAVTSVLVARRTRREIHAVRVLTYKCARCLHEWEQQEGKPPPRPNEAMEVLEDYRAVFGGTKEDTGPQP
jgi:hypothetical protein